MGAFAKAVVGLALFLLGLSMLGGGFLARSGIHVRYLTSDVWLGSLIIVIAGTVPLLLVLTGLFVLWLEWEEMRSSKEFKRLERAERKRGRK